MQRRLALFCLSLALALLTSPAHGAVGHIRQEAGAKTLRLAGLRERVTVRRDARGIPYIEANSEGDLYFAQGYVTASDRLWQMDLLRRTARGELAEIFGAGPNNVVLEGDKRRRTYDFARIAEASMAHTSAPVRAALEAYARGVNAYIRSLDEKSIPVEFRILGYMPRPWRPEDSQAVGLNFVEMLSRPWSQDLMRASLSDLPEEKLQQLLPVTSPLDVIVVGGDPARRKGAAPRRSGRERGAVPSSEGLARELARVTESVERSLAFVGLFIEDVAASNNWVVSGRHTTTGRPMLANDPHLPSAAPPIWYLTHLSAPGMRVAGVTAPGAPGIIIGHNSSIAWGLTNVGPDVQDLYAEKFDPSDPKRYAAPGGWREAVVRREEIKVRRGFANPSTETVVHDVTSTRNGPVVFEKDGRRYALRWTAFDARTANTFEAFVRLNHARDWNEFRSALRLYLGPMQNFIYADTRGQIGYYAAGAVPLRKTGDGSVPYDGSTDEGEWAGHLPFEQMPHVFNPPSGVIVTANNRVIGRSYRHHLTHEWAAPYRARRILDLLGAKRKLSAEDFRAIQADTYSIGGIGFARAFIRLLEAEPDAGQPVANAGLSATMALLKNWDGRLTAESRAAPLVGEMRAAFRGRILAAAIGPERAKNYRWANSDTFLDRILAEQPREWLPKEFKSYAALLLASHADARATLAQKLGADEAAWVWGRYVEVRFPHPLAGVPLVGRQFALGPFPQQGSGSFAGATVNVGASVSMRFIADTSDWNDTRQGIAPGQSGDPKSPHWKDQIEEWRTASHGLFPFDPGAVAAAAREIFVMEPE